MDPGKEAGGATVGMAFRIRGSRLATGFATGIALVSAMLAATPEAARALAIAIRAPMIISDPASIEFDSQDQGTAQVNPLGALHVLEPGYAVTTMAIASDVSGVLAGRTGFGLVVDRPGTLPPAFSEANVTGDATVPGLPGTYVYMYVTLDLHGRFIGVDGAPAIGMRGTLSVAGVADAAPSYQVTSAVDWEMPAGIPAVQTTTWAFMGNNPSAFYPAAQPLVVSSHPDGLFGQARVGFLAEGGTQIFIEADLQGSAVPLVAQGISQESDGEIDFFNTGVLRVYVAEGVELENANGALASAAVVPEPSGAVGLMSGIGLVAGFVRRRRKTTIRPA